MFIETLYYYWQGCWFYSKVQVMLISGTVALAARAGMSELTAGLTVVALGTSLPESLIRLSRFADSGKNPA